MEMSQDDISFEAMNKLVTQSKEFKYSVDMVNQIQSKLDLIEWKDKAAKLLAKFDPKSEPQNDTEEGQQKPTPKNVKKPNILDEINALIRDAQKVIFPSLKTLILLQKEFTECREYRSILEYVDRIKAYKTKLFEVIKYYDDSSDYSEQEESESGKHSIVVTAFICSKSVFWS